MAQTAIPQLPPDVVKAVFSLAPLRDSMKDRVTGQAVCKSWRAALLDLAPFDELVLNGTTPLGQCLWIFRTKPAFERVVVMGNPHGLLPLVLHSIRLEALRELEFGECGLDMPLVLPFPHVLAKLEHLVLRQESSGPLSHWLPRLGALRHLQLDLPSVNNRAVQQVALPPLPQLTSLHAQAGRGRDSSCNVTIPLQDLRSLQSLHLRDFGGVDLTAGSRVGSVAGQLTALELLDVDYISVGFKVMPALASAALGDYYGIDGAETIAAAGQLTQLSLGAGPEYGMEEWHVELLRHAPPSLRALVLLGAWPQGLAAALGDREQLQVLAVDTIDDSFQLPPPGAALWSGLQALCHCVYGEESSPPVPEALLSATRLERLHFFTPVPSIADLHTLSGLPALRHLVLEELEEQTVPTALKAAAAVLPGVAVAAGAGIEWQEFVEVALGTIKQQDA